jgi:thiamine biosynthesis lipoprotein
VNDESVVTSGDYQRTYVVDGKAYHHLIDPVTLMPANYFRSVSVLTPDSGLADFYSTTLFLLPLEEGRIAAATAGVDVLWFLPDGTQVATAGMKAVLKTLGGATNK